jgi:hypothetical protein
VAEVPEELGLMAGKRDCPSCASEIPSDMDRCFICGYEFAGKPSNRPWRLWVALLLLIVFLFPLIRMLLKAIR